MSHSDSNSCPSTDIPTNPPVSIISTEQSIDALLSDIPFFSLGPSLYDYVRVSLNTTSSIASQSPPCTPPPEPIPIDTATTHLNDRSPLHSAQSLIITSLNDEHQVASLSDNLEQSPSSQMSHAIHKLESGHNSLLAGSEYSQIPNIDTTAAAFQATSEPKVMSGNVLFLNTESASATVCLCNGSANPTKPVNYTRHKRTEAQIGTAELQVLDNTDNASRAANDRNAIHTYRKYEGLFLPCQLRRKN